MNFLLRILCAGLLFCRVLAEEPSPSAASVLEEESNLSAASVLAEESNPSAASVLEEESNPSAASVLEEESSPSAVSVLAEESNPGNAGGFAERADAEEYEERADVETYEERTAAGTAAERADAEEWMTEILGEMDFTGLDDFSREELPERMTFSKLVTSLADSGTGKKNLKELTDYLLDVFFYELRAAKPMFLQILGLSLLFSLFGRVLAVKQSYVSELGFFAVYAGVMVLLVNSFLLAGNVVEAGIAKLLSFMTAFIPAYAAAMMLSGHVTSAGVFYELAFVLIYLLEIGIHALFLPCVHIFVMLEMMDHLFEETRLSRLAEMIESGVRSALKLALAAVVGLGVVQSFLAPAKDRLSANVVFRSMQAVPGVGNTFGAAGEILLSCGIMIKNSVGTAGLLVLIVLSAAPALSVACFHIMYRLTGAILQPFCDKRISECVHGVGRGCALYLKIVVDTMLLLFITISMIGASTSFMF